MSIRFTKKWGRPFSGPKLEEVRSHGTAGDDGAGDRRALILGERCDDRHKPAWTRVATGLCHEPGHLAMILFVRAMSLASLAASFALLARSFASLAKDVDRSSSH